MVLVTLGVTIPAKYGGGGVRVAQRVVVGVEIDIERLNAEVKTRQLRSHLSFANGELVPLAVSNAFEHVLTRP